MTSTDEHAYEISTMRMKMLVPDVDPENGCNDFEYWNSPAIAVKPWWGDEFQDRAPVPSIGETDCDSEATGWWNDGNQFDAWTGDVTTLAGSYDMRLRKAGTLSDCDWVGEHDVTLEIFGERISEDEDETLDSARRRLVRLPENPLDIDEDDMACTASSTASTTMQLVTWPGWSHPVPLAIDGQRQHLFSEMTSVSVNDWNDANTLRIFGKDGSYVELNPSSPSASLSGGIWPMGGATWISGSSESGAFEYPTVSITHSCPASFGALRRPVDQAYALTLAGMDAAIDEATGGTGLDSLMAVADDTDWPVVVARVYGIHGAPDADGFTHVLDFELQGSRVHTLLPLTQTSLGHWDLDHDEGDWDLEGEVIRRPGKLTLDLTSGSVNTGSGTLQLTPTTIELPVYPAEE